ncbi:Uncharacterised protein [Salmonella enterica subsp. enterica serovar Bovismorbificans]|uniref:Uncharacterized protein n=1 Tax=Salmonella enterica subsp. enterica serovar Bovismorbificans TaxID=58097 RepID=A0A655DLE3_SALET|nr:Uncharacterised protein [Salmonella enterica subsp. enterica serovar Bovismorbificans]
MFNVSWNVHSGVNASILGKIPVRQANAVKVKHHIPTVNANARLRINTYSGLYFCASRMTAIKATNTHR